MPSQRCPDCGRFLPRGFVASLAERTAPCPRCGVALDATRLATDAPAPAAATEASTPTEATTPTEAFTPTEATTPAEATTPTEATTPSERTAPTAAAGTFPPEPSSAAADTSVRPPDLAPDLVRDDVLAGWDVGVGPADMARWREDRRPFPTDTVVVAGAAAGGLLLGAALGAVLDERPGRGAVVGTVVGALAAAAGRRIWRLAS